MKRTRCAVLAAGLVMALAAGCAGSGDGDADALDPRVVNGLVQRPGGSGYYDSQWVAGKVIDLALPDVQECLRSKGREDVVPKARYYIARFRSMQFNPLPNPEWYRTEGAVPAIYREGLNEQESAEEEASLGCYTEVTESRGLFGSETTEVAQTAARVESDWVDEITVYFDANPMEEKFNEFESCLSAKTGYPPEGIRPGYLVDPYAFTDWWEAQHGGIDISQEDNLEGGRVFADCLEIYTDARAEATDDMRNDFIDAHYQDLKTVNDALVG